MAEILYNWTVTPSILGFLQMGNNLTFGMLFSILSFVIFILILLVLQQMEEFGRVSVYGTGSKFMYNVFIAGIISGAMSIMLYVGHLVNWWVMALLFLLSVLSLIFEYFLGRKL